MSSRRWMWVLWVVAVIVVGAGTVEWTRAQVETAVAPGGQATISGEMAEVEKLAAAGDIAGASAPCGRILELANASSPETLSGEDWYAIGTAHYYLMADAYDKALKAGGVDADRAAIAKQWRDHVAGAAAEPTIQVIAQGQKVNLADYVVKGKTTVFDFYSEYCPPCVAIAPALKKLAESRSDVVVVKVDINRPGVRGIDWGSPTAQQFGLRSIPHFKIYGPDGKLKDLKKTGSAFAVGVALLGMLGALLMIVMMGTVVPRGIAEVARPMLAGEAPELKDVWLAVYFPAICLLMCWAWLRVGRALLWQMQDTSQGRETGPADWWAAAHYSLRISRGEIAARVVAGEGWPYRRGRTVPHLDLSRRSVRVLAWVSLVGGVVSCLVVWYLGSIWETTSSWWAGTGAGGVAAVACLCLSIPWAWTGGSSLQRARMWVVPAIFWPMVVWAVAQSDSAYQSAMALTVVTLLGALMRWAPRTGEATEKRPSVESQEQTS